MSGQPTEAQEEFFDATLDKLQALKLLAEAALTCLEDGEFEAAVSHMDEGCCLVSGSVWETVMHDVEKIRDISDEIERSN